MGHLKAYYTLHDMDPEKDKDKCKLFEEKRAKILAAHIYLLNYAITHGHSYTRWQNITTMMIEKELGNHKIHRLRVIHICEADCNLLLCVKWRNVVQHASQEGTLNPSQKWRQTRFQRPRRGAHRRVGIRDL